MPDVERPLIDRPIPVVPHVVKCEHHMSKLRQILELTPPGVRCVLNTEDLNEGERERLIGYVEDLFDPKLRSILLC